MTAILTPALALRHLRELSTDVRAAVALGPGGERLAGDAAIEAPARALLALAGDRAAWTIATARGAVLLARTPAAAFVVAAGPRALLPLLRHDLETLLRDTVEPDSATADGVRASSSWEPHAAVERDVQAAVDTLIDAAEGISGH